MGEQKYKSKGRILFRLTKDSIETQTYDREYYINYWKDLHSDKDFVNSIVDDKFKTEYTHDIYHLIPGEEFLDAINSGAFTDYDGHIKDVFVDGYISNLGLATNNVTGGMFLVDKDVWIEICKIYKVEVNWVNK